MAQAPQAINYQGVARNASGVAYAGQLINVRLSIHTGTPDGIVEYSETRAVTTNQFGLFNVQIGSEGASNVQGNFTSINWSSGSKFLQTEISVNSQPFANLGTTQMMSVPFSLHSNESKDLIFPFSKSMGTTGNMFSLTNDNTSNSSNTIKSTAVGGRAFYGSATTGVGGFFLSNSGMGIYSESNSGTAVWGESPNGNGIMGISNNVNGIGVTAINNVNGVALVVDGNVRINGGNTNPGVGKVLTSDANGNATWQAFSAGTGNFKLPIDTTVDINTTVFRIKNVSPLSVSAIFGESVSGVGIYGSSEKSSGVRGNTSAKNEAATSGITFADSSFGILGKVHANYKDGAGVFGDGSTNNNGVRGKSYNKAGVQGFSEKNYGIYGESKDFIAVQGLSTHMTGVSGESTNGVGVTGLSFEGNGAVYGGAGMYTSKRQFGVMGEAFGQSTGVLAKSHGDDAKALVVEGKIKITGTGTSPAEGKVLTSDASGNATWENPYTIAFRASGLKNDIEQTIPDDGGGRKIMFFQVARYNIGNAYNAENSIFFPPVAGVYHFNTQTDLTGSVAYLKLAIKLLRNGVISTIAESEVSALENSITITQPSLTTDIALLPNDAVWVEIDQSNNGNSSKNLSALGYKTWFAGHLVTKL